MGEASPYITAGPTLISFSGGRTSAFMLHETLRAYGGRLPEHVVVAFANTGKEREETLRFVHECGSRWGVRIRWIEWRDSEPGFEEVGFNSASRNGEPFAALIAKRGFVPNGVSRFCSITLKVRAMTNFVRAKFGWKRWTSMIGLRHDEGLRVIKAYARNDSGKDAFRAAMPLAKAKVTVRDVAEFWNKQPFDLELESYEGNCDLCFLKSRGKLHRLIRDNPGMVAWWESQEQACRETATETGATFRLGESYADLRRQVVTQPYMPGLFEDDGDYDAECGLTCSPMELEDAAPAPSHGRVG